MLVWRRLRVFVQLLNVLCVIGDVVPAGESSPWRGPTAARIVNGVTSTARDATNGVSSTSRDDITANFLRNFDDRSMTSAKKPPEVGRTIEALEVPSMETQPEVAKTSEALEVPSMEMQPEVPKSSEALEVPSMKTQPEVARVSEGLEVPSMKMQAEVARTSEGLEVPSMKMQAEVARTSEGLEVPSMETQPEVARVSEGLEVPLMKTQPEVARASEGLEVPSIKTQPEVARTSEGLEVPSMETPPEVARTFEALEVPSMETQPEVARVSEGLEVPSMKMQPEVAKTSEALEVPSLEMQPEVPKSSEALEVPSMKTQPEVARVSEGLEVPLMKTQPEVARASEGLEVPSIKTQPEVARISEGLEVPSMETQPEVARVSEGLEVPSMKMQAEVARTSEGLEVPSMKTQPEVARTSEGLEVPLMETQPEVARVSEGLEVPSMKTQPEVARTSEALEVPSMQTQPEVPMSSEALEVPSMKTQPEVARTSEAFEVPSMKTQPEVARTSEGAEVPSIKTEPEVATTSEAFEVPSMKTQPEVATISEAFEETLVTMQPEVMRTFEDLEVNLVTAQPEVPRTSEALEVTSIMIQPEVAKTRGGKLENRSLLREPKEVTEDSKLAVPISLNLLESDFSNVVESTTQPTDSDIPLPECKIVEPPSLDNSSTIDDLEPVTSSDQQALVEDSAGEDLEVLGTTPQSLTVSWKQPETSTVNHYIVNWYQQETLIAACRISTKAPNVTITIAELQPCTNYTVKVRPDPPLPEKERVVSGITKLEVNKKSVKLEVSATGTTWIAIRWSLPRDDCVDHYVVGFSDHESAETMKTNETAFNKTNLITGHDYIFNLTIHGSDEVFGSIHIRAETTSLVIVPEIEECEIVEPPPTTSPTADKSEYSVVSGAAGTTMAQEFQQTKEGEINVECLGFAHLKPNSLAITWKKPNSTVEVKDYIIQWSTKTAAVHSCRLSNETFFYAITELDACTTYSVEVLPRLETVNGSKRVVTGTTGLNVTKHLTDFKIAENSTDWLKVSWSMPSTDCVKDYLISVCDGNNCTEDRINTTTYNKTDLSPCRTYNFNLTVFAQSSAEAYGATNVNGTTNFLKPGAPTPAETESGNYTLKVSWPEPIGHTCVDHYRVTWNRDGKSGTKKTTATMIEFKEMESCATYDIIITPVDINLGEGPQEIIQSKMTLPALTDPPVRLDRPSGTANSITINWLIRTNETNNCNAMLMIVECKWTQMLGEGYYPNNGVAEYNIHSNTNNEAFDTAVEKLSPFTKYDCKSYTINPGGRSRESEIVSAQTLEALPSAPELFPASASNVTNTSITLQWKKPRYLPGILTNITIYVTWYYQSHRPRWCTNLTEIHTTIAIPGNATSYFYHAQPYSVYFIEIQASTGAGWGNTGERLIFMTEPGAPGEVTDLTYTQSENAADPNVLDSTLTWGMPCFLNGEKLEYFYVTGRGTRNGLEHHIISHILSQTDACRDEICNLPMIDLREEYNYTVQVAAKVTDYNDLGAVSTTIFEYPAGIPPEPNENYTDLISIDPYKARRTTTTATVLLPIFPDTGGDISCYAIVVSKMGYTNQSFARLKNNDEPQTASWQESKLRDFEIPYQAAKFCIDVYPSYIVDYGRLKAVKFVLGEDTETCPKISSYRDEQSYCNGPLNPDTWYDVRMRAFTAGGYRDSIAFHVKTNSELDVATVVGTVFGILFLGILATMMLLVRKCSIQAVLRRFLHSDMPGSPVPAPFTRRKFIAHCQQLADNPGKLSNEYQLLQTLSVDLQMPTNAACLQANRKKNRYTDILPYDFSRVKLEVIDNDPNTDYINASFIKGFTGDEDYVACQGPKEETTYDFWRMIDQYDVKLIVMLTQLVEKNKEKCHQYFPTIRETFTYENMSIRCSMELDYRTYTQRTLVLQKENAKRNIIHLHFKDWPDHDVPEDFDPMINFCQIMRRHMEANRGLVVIHCSAGIGRTGTLIAIDILLQHIKDNRKLDVFGTVYRLRHHRINMVQRESQYAYIYNCIRQVLKNPYFSKTYKPPSVEAIGDNSSHKKKEASDSSTNLVSSIETLKKSSLSTSVESADPIYQNSSKSTPESRTFYSLNGLRCAKSTSAIDTRPYQEHIGRYNTHDHLISDTAKDALIDYSEISLDITESEGSTTSLYENMQPLSRSKSAQGFGRDEDPRVTQRLLEHDTSL